MQAPIAFEKRPSETTTNLLADSLCREQGKGTIYNSEVQTGKSRLSCLR
jgi:hypothetical protein